jgi:hypothetical protein
MMVSGFWRPQQRQPRRQSATESCDNSKRWNAVIGHRHALHRRARLQAAMHSREPDSEEPISREKSRRVLRDRSSTSIWWSQFGQLTLRNRCDAITFTSFQSDAKSVRRIIRQSQKQASCVRLFNGTSVALYSGLRTACSEPSIKRTSREFPWSIICAVPAEVLCADRRTSSAQRR